MIKKTIVGGAAALGLAYLLMGTSAFSYLGSAYNYVKGTINENVPVEMKVAHAKGLVERLENDIRHQVHVVAECQADLKKLEPMLAGLEDKAEVHRTMLFRQENDLKGDRPVYVYAGRRYDANQVKQDMRQRLELLKGNEEQISYLKQTMTARQQKLENAKLHYEKMVAAKEQAKVRLANLEAKLELLAATRAETDMNLDNSTLGELNELVSGLETYVDAEGEYARTNTRHGGLIPTDDVPATDVLEELAQYRAKYEQNARTTEEQLISHNAE